MSETKIIFTFNGTDLTIHCTPEDKIRDICQKLSIKIETNINSLIFLYGGKPMNMDLRFKEHANSLDRSNNVMRVLVYIKEVDDYICPNCGEKIKIKTEKIDEIISSNNNIKDTIDGIKFNIDNVINKIILFNTNIKTGIDVYLNNNKINMIQDGTLWTID